MEKFFAALVGVAFASLAHAQQPSDKKEVLPIQVGERGERRDRVLKASEIDEGQRHMLWQNTKVDPDGFLRIQSTTDYVLLPSQFARHPKFNNRHRLDLPVAGERGDIELLGSLEEDKLRVSWLFRYGNKQAIFTVWRYKEAGATITVPEEFLNQAIDGVQGVLSLSQVDGSTNALWKLTWWKDGSSYELYVEEDLNNANKPLKSQKDIVRLGEYLTQVTK